MSKLPPVKRFISDDFAGISAIPALCEKLFYPLNLFLNSVYSALKNGLTLSENTVSVVQSSAQVTTNASGMATTTVNWPYTQTPPVGLAILRCLSGTTGALAPLYSWTYTPGLITVSLQFITVSGASVVTAASATTYTLTFWASAG